MSSKYLNRASIRTRKIIRQEFARSLSEKKTVDKISITDLSKNAKISRATFYQHYKSIEAIVKDIKSEITNAFVKKLVLNKPEDIDKFFIDFKKFLLDNKSLIQHLVKSKDAVFYFINLSQECKNKFLEFYCKTRKDVDKNVLDLEVSVIFNGIVLELILYFAHKSDKNLDFIFKYTLNKMHNIN